VSSPVTVTIDDAPGGGPGQPKPNQPPIMTPGPGLMRCTVGQLCVFLQPAVDPNDDPLTYTAQGLPEGGAIDAASGLCGFVPTRADRYTITITATDPGGLSDSAPAMIDAQAGSTTPRYPVIGFIAPTRGNGYIAPATVALAVAASAGPSGSIQNVEFFLEGGASVGQATSSPYQVVLRNVPAGKYRYRAVVSSSAGTETAFSEEITVNNGRAPVFTNIGHRWVEVGKPLTFRLPARDPDGEPLTITGVNLPAGSTVRQEGNVAVFDWPSAGPSLVYEPRFVAKDTRGNRAETLIRITVWEAGAGEVRELYLYDNEKKGTVMDPFPEYHKQIVDLAALKPNEISLQWMLTIRAETLGLVRSTSFTWQGEDKWERWIDYEGPPWDTGLGCHILCGWHTVTITPHTDADAYGRSGKPTTVRFGLIDSNRTRPNGPLCPPTLPPEPSPEPPEGPPCPPPEGEDPLMAIPCEAPPTDQPPTTGPADLTPALEMAATASAAASVVGIHPYVISWTSQHAVGCYGEGPFPIHHHLDHLPTAGSVTVNVGIPTRFAITCHSASSREVMKEVFVDVPAAVPSEGLQLWLTADRGIRHVEQHPTEDYPHTDAAHAARVVHAAGGLGGLSDIGALHDGGHDDGPQVGPIMVGEWVDYSGLDHHARQPDPTRQATLVEDGTRRGMPAVRFDGVDDYLRVPLPVNGWTGMTAVLVHRNATDVDGAAGVGAPLAWDGPSPDRLMFVNPASAAASFRFEMGTASGASTFRRPASIARELTRTVLIKRGATEELYVDGARVLLQGGRVGPIAQTGDALLIGRGLLDPAHAAGVSARHALPTFAGDLAEVLVYNRALSAAELAQVDAHLRLRHVDPGVAVDGEAVNLAEPVGTVKSGPITFRGNYLADPSKPKPDAVSLAFRRMKPLPVDTKPAAATFDAGSGVWTASVSWALAPDRYEFQVLADVQRGASSVTVAGDLETITVSSGGTPVGTPAGGRRLDATQLRVSLRTNPAKALFAPNESVEMIASVAGDYAVRVNAVQVTVVRPSQTVTVPLTRQGDGTYRAKPKIGTELGTRTLTARAFVPSSVAGAAPDYADSGSVVFRVANPDPCAGGNCKPVAVATVSAAVVRAGASVTLSGGQSYDPEGQRLTTYAWSQIGGDSQGYFITYQTNTEVLTRLPAGVPSAVVTFQLIVRDNLALASDPATVSFTVSRTGTTPQPGNRAPSFPGPERLPRKYAGRAGQPLSIPIVATDPNGDRLTYRIVGAPVGASFNTSTGQFSWTPTAEQAKQRLVAFTVTASDGTLSASITITVEFSDQTTGNNPPDILFTATPATIVPPRTDTILRWSVNAKGAANLSCYASGGSLDWTRVANKIVPNSQQVVVPTADETTYGLSCVTSGGSRLTTVIVRRSGGVPTGYSVSVPTGVFPGASFRATWNGPDDPGNQVITLFAGNGAFDEQAVAGRTGSTTLTAPNDPGDYIIEYAADANLLASTTLTVQADTGEPMLNFSADRTVLPPGVSTAVLSWDARNVSTCTGAGGTGNWASGKPLASTGYSVTVPGAGATFLLTCSGVRGSVTGSITITREVSGGYSLSVTPRSIVRGGRIFASWTKPDTAPSRTYIWVGLQGAPNQAYRNYKVLSDSAVSGTTEFYLSQEGIYELRIIEGGSYPNYNVVATAGPVYVGNQVGLSFTAAPTSIQQGEPTHVTWEFTAEKSSTCTASGAPTWSGKKATIGNADLFLENSATLTLTCTDGQGQSVTKSVNVTVAGRPGPPTIDVFTATPKGFGFNDSPFETTLHWELRNVSSCRGSNGWDKIITSTVGSFVTRTQRTTTFTITCQPVRPAGGGASPYGPVSASVTVQVDGSSAAPTLSVSPVEVAKGERIDVTWGGGLAGGKYWIGVYPTNVNMPWPGWSYPVNGPGGTFPILAPDPTPDASREYLLRLHPYGSSDILASASVIVLAKPRPQAPGTPGPVFISPPSTYDTMEGASIQLSVEARGARTYRMESARPAGAQFTADPDPTRTDDGPARFAWQVPVGAATWPNKDGRYPLIFVATGASGTTRHTVTITVQDDGMYDVSGAVRSNGAPVPGVTLTLTLQSTVGIAANPPPLALTAVTIADGTYRIPQVAIGTYVLVPAKDSLTFMPQQRTVTVAKSSVTADFEARTAVTPSQPTLPIVAFTVTPSRRPAPLTVTATATSPPAGLLYDWDCRNGAARKLIPNETTHTCTFTTAGTYIIGLQVTGQDGKGGTISSGWATQPVIVDNPSANSAVTGTVLDKQGKPLPGIPVSLTHQATDVVVGSATSDKAGDYLFSKVEPGAYLVSALGGTRRFSPSFRSVTVVAGKDVTDVDFQALDDAPPAGPPDPVPQPNPQPQPKPNNPPTVVLQIDKASGVAPVTVNFTAIASDPDGDRLSYRWDYGDGQSMGWEDNTRTSHTYSKPGTYLAMVWVRDPSGKEASSGQTIAVQKPAAPEVLLTTDKPSYKEGDTIKVSWSVKGAADSCNATDAWSGDKPVTGGPVSVTAKPPKMRFAMTCTGPGGPSPEDWVEVTVAVK
jgi:hypothetical protein